MSEQETHDDRCESEFIIPAGGWTRCGCASRSEQETPRTVEEAAREEAGRRFRLLRAATGDGTADGVARITFVAGATWQAARMPSEEQVAAWLWRVDHPARMDGAPLHAQRLYADKARALLALWGAP